jgi:hypothetical protein
MYVDVYSLFVYDFTNHYHRVETEMQLINIICHLRWHHHHCVIR